MAEFYSFFGGTTQDPREYDQTQFAEVLERLFKTGIFPNVDNKLQVVESDPVRLAVRVNTGQAWINGYWYKNDDWKELDLPSADATHPRIHRIVLRLDTVDNRNIIATVKQGSAAAEPNPPSLERNEQIYELSLAQVYVGPGVTSVSDVDITDERNNPNLCGDALSHELKLHQDSINAHNDAQIDVQDLNNHFTSGKLNEVLDELFMFADNGKNAIASVVGAPATANDTFSELEQHIRDAKGIIATNLNSKDVSATSNEALQALADKITQIQQAIGNALASHVLEGYTFSSEEAGIDVAGTMSNNGAVNITPGTTNQSIPAGYTSGGTVSSLGGNASVSEVLEGNTFSSNTVGRAKSGTMNNVGQQIITPGTTSKAINQGYHNGNGYVEGDSNLSASNIKDGVNIFGVAGSLVEGVPMATGTKQTSWNSSISMNGLHVRGLNFAPNMIVAYLENAESTDSYHGYVVFSRKADDISWYHVRHTGDVFAGVNGDGSGEFGGENNDETEWFSDGFSVNVAVVLTYRWYAFKV